MRIVIVGGGIAGLTSALALAPHGHAITLVERRTGFGEPGAGIQLSPNATRILTDLGLGHSLARLGTEPGGIVVHDLRSGRAIGSVGLGHMRERYGAPYVAMARADLHTALLDAVRGRTDIGFRIGRTAVALEQDPDGLRVTFESGGGTREVVAADLLVGADGLWSAIRPALGDTRLPVYGGYSAFRAVLRAEVVPETLGSAPGLWLGRGRHVVHYPVAAGRLVNLVVVARRRQPLRGWSTVEARDGVLAGLDGAADLLMELAARAESWSGWSLYDLPARRLAVGRVALMGDAAHPVLPYLAQGASLGIEDAAHLAARLGGDLAGVARALKRYERERLGRVRRVQAAARRNGKIYHAGPLVAAARNLVIRRLGPTGMSERYAWIHGWRPPAPVGST